MRRSRNADGKTDLEAPAEFKYYLSFSPHSSDWS